MGVRFLSNLSALYSDFLLQQTTWWYETKLLPAVLSGFILVFSWQTHGMVPIHYFSLVSLGLYAITFFSSECPGFSLFRLDGIIHPKKSG